MARRKNAPDQVRIKCKLAERFRELRLELFGERGGPEMARRLNLPVRTWYNYEAGVTVPAEVVLRIVELTSVEPTWLLHGQGPRFRNGSPSLRDSGEPKDSSVTGLLRAALQQLENDESVSRVGRLRLREVGTTQDPDDPSGEELDHILVSVEDSAVDAHGRNGAPQYIAAQRDWLAAERECRCLRVNDDAMVPLVSNGAYVAYSDLEEKPQALDGVLAVVWIDDQPLVRWIQIQGQFVILRAQNPETKPITVLIEMADIVSGRKRLRRVLWISTPR